MLKECRLCPRECGVDRSEGKKGYCGASNELKVARAALHMWEEPCISGEAGSGAVFFSGCPMRCRFCQNYSIAAARKGKVISIERLAQIFLELQEKGAANINLVTPTHYTLHIIKALDLAKENGLRIPVVYNTSGYEKTETLKLLRGYIDIYLPDFKYMDGLLAAAYSNAPDYPEYAKRALEEMVGQTGPLKLDEETGMARSGVIVRHLVLPGQAEGAKQVMDWVAREFSKGTVLFSLMSQYTPYGRADQFPEIDRKLRRGEIRAVQDYMDALGLDGFTQERTSAKREYTPPFDLSGL